MTTPPMALALTHQAQPSEVDVVAGARTATEGLAGEQEFAWLMVLFLVTDHFEEDLFEMALVLVNEIAHAPFHPEFTLVKNGHAVADRLDFAQFVGGKEHEIGRASCRERV